MCYQKRTSPSAAIDEVQRVAGQRVAAPGDMAVRPHQHELALVQRADVGLIDRDDFQRHAARAGGRDECARVRRIRAEAQQREAAPEQVEGRAAVGEPGVRRAPARMARRAIVARILGFRRRRAVGHADRRALVAVAEMGVERVLPGHAVAGGKPLAEFARAPARLPASRRASPARRGGRHSARNCASPRRTGGCRPGGARPRSCRAGARRPSRDASRRASSRDRPHRRRRCSCRARRSAASRARRRPRGTRGRAP